MPSTAGGAAPPATAAAYAIEREYDDLAAVARPSRRRPAVGVEVVGHSYGGRCALGAALRTDAIARVVCYEGAPAAGRRRATSPPGWRRSCAACSTPARPTSCYATFLTRIVGMPPAELAAYRDDPIWPVRAATAATIVRELEAERSPAAGLDALGAVRQPVLQILGGESLPVFARATAALDERLADGRVAVIAGARHAAHHTHPAAFVGRGAGRPCGCRGPRARLTGMLEMNWIGWLVVGLIAGAISGSMLGGTTARGCLPNVVVGILGGVLGGWLATQMGFGQAQGFIAALVVAVLGSLVVRLVLNAIASDK